MLRVRRGKLPLLALAVGATLPTLGYAQTFNWNFNAGGGAPFTASWNVNTNWNPNTGYPTGTQANVFFNAGSLTNGSGTIILDSIPVTIGKLTIQPIGTVVNGNSYTLKGNGSLTIHSGGTIDISSSGTVSPGVATINLQLRSPADSTIFKVGTGAVVLSGTNSFGGGAGVNGLAVNGGSVVATSAGALSGLAIVTTANDGVLELQNQTVGTIPVPVVGGIGATVAPVNGSLYASTGASTWNGNLFVLQNASVGVGAGATLTVNGNIFDGAGSVGNGITKVGDGRLVVNNLAINGPVAINGGRVQIKAGATPNLAAGKSTASSLAITGTGQLDLTNNTLTVHYGANPSPAADIRAMLASGRGTGNWQGATGIMSSGVSNSQHALGYRDVTGTQDVVVMYTLTGDTNLDGLVNFTDLVPFAANYNKPAPVSPGYWQWANGDFTYDGVINFTDLVPFAANYGKSLAALPAPVLASLSAEFISDWNAAVAVPEPTSLTLLALGGLGLLARRRRSV